MSLFACLSHVSSSQKEGSGPVEWFTDGSRTKCWTEVEVKEADLNYPSGGNVHNGQLEITASIESVLEAWDLECSVRMSASVQKTNGLEGPGFEELNFKVGIVS